MKEMKLLVINTDSLLTRLLQENLDSNAYQIISTPCTGDELRAVLDIAQPDIVLLDIMTPALEGIQICLRLRQWSRVPIIMLSARKCMRDRIRGLDLNSDSYLTEPFDFDQLETRIQNAVHCNAVAEMS